MTREQAIERARKLMALGESENEHEAALAMAQAQRILERFEIETADLDGPAPDPEPMTEGTWRCGGRTTMVHWRLSAASALASANGCTLFYSGPKVTVCGRRSDVRRAAKLWGWICPEVERLSRRHCVGKGTSYAHSFKVGAVHAIRKEIERESRELREELRGKVTETALMVIDRRREEADRFMRADHRLSRSSYTSGARSSGGFEAGRSAGAGVYGSAGRGQVGPGGTGRLGTG